MNTVKIVSIALISTFVLFSCKNEEKTNLEISKTSENDLALAKITPSEEISTNDYLYVTATTGLSLREYANLQSEKLAVMPFGTRVKVIASENNPTMKVGEIKGGMDEIEYNQKKGFAFNGFLSKYFPPEKGISAKRYAEELKNDFPKIVYTETTGGTASKPTNSESVTLPNTQWHEAFYMAQQLYSFPKEFIFPSSKGKEFQIIKEKKFQKDNWISELQIFRKNNAFTKIEYVYKNKGFLKTVTIVKVGDVMKILSTEKVE
ncbi:MAG: SH3 domain-containing protein [Flavobacteriaceae bacterium]|nr:SH3 domain-containing protein [Flavobacteriaceae bacterium]